MPEIFSCLAVANPNSTLMWGIMWSFYTISEICALYSGLPSHEFAPEFIHGGVLFMLHNPICFSYAVLPVGAANITMYLLFRPEVYIFANYALQKSFFS